MNPFMLLSQFRRFKVLVADLALPYRFANVSFLVLLQIYFPIEILSTNLTHIITIVLLRNMSNVTMAYRLFSGFNLATRLHTARHFAIHFPTDTCNTTVQLLNVSGHKENKK